MPFSDFTPRLNFLKDSASSLSTLSPSTAAYLMTAHNHIFLGECKPLNQRQHEASCGACGSFRNPEWTKTKHVTKKKVKRSSSSAAKGATADGATVYKCLRCRRRTIRPTRKEPPRVTAATSGPITQQTASIASLPAEKSSDPAEVNRPSKTTENATSKKRAKARKQGGLQALMVSKQSKANSSLDLFDFLQQ